MRRLKFEIEYEGTHYHGWQRQPNFLSVQQAFEQALEKITHMKTKIVGSGRTDSGVHAMAQVAHCNIETLIPNEKLQRALNGTLPRDIIVKSIETVGPTFHAQRSSTSKIYRYQILNTPGPSALYRNFCWWIPTPLDLAKMNEIAGLVVGTHDFKAFQNTGSNVTSTVRTIMQSKFELKPPFLTYYVEGNGFLRQMVRNLVGTFVHAGLGSLTPDQFRQIVEGRDRTKAPKSAPARGLFLQQVFH